MKTKAKKTKKLPAKIIRIDDNEIFFLAKDGFYYNKKLVLNYPGLYHFGYSYDCLMNKHKGSFKAI